jgi:hypothetical protein
MKADFVKVVLFAAVLALTACSEPAANTAKKEVATAKKEPEGPPKPISAKTAFWEVYKPAHEWAADLQPFGIKSETADGFETDGGLSPRWTISFVSASRHEARTYYYSVVSQPPLILKGIKADSAVPWAGPSADAMAFQTSEFKFDSDEAFKVAAAKAEEWLKKHPGKKPTMSLGNASRYTAPMWYILWGDKKDGFAGFVNASTGAYGTK